MSPPPVQLPQTPTAPGEQGKDLGPSSPTPPDTHRYLPTPFLTKTYQLVDDPAIDDIISWNDDGSTFVVWRPAEFARDLLPKYFKHNNFSSFVRQLNTYGFRKIVPDRWEFANDCFKKGEKRLLADIHRRKNNPPSTGGTPTAAIVAASHQMQTRQAVPAATTPRSTSAEKLDVSPPNSGDEQMDTSPSTSPPSTAAAIAATIAAAAPSTSGLSGNPTATTAPPTPTATSDLLGENERLRKENMHLNQELTQMKSLCNNILMLMSNYASRSRGASPSGSGPGSGETFAAAADPRKDVLELMPMRASSSEESSQETTVDRAKHEDSGSGGGGGSSSPSPSPMLFGVHIGVKRLRVVDDTDGSGSCNGPESCSGEEYQLQRHEQHLQQQLQGHKMVTDVKSEQVDGGVSDGEEPSSDSRWLSCGRGC